MVFGWMIKMKYFSVNYNLKIVLGQTKNKTFVNLAQLAHYANPVNMKIIISDFLSTNAVYV